MLSTIIQRQIPLNSEVKFVLKSGSEISGILIELGRNHVTVEREGKPATILLEMIGAWEVLTSDTTQDDKNLSVLEQDNNLLVNDEVDSFQIRENISELNVFALPLVDDLDNKEASVQMGDEETKLDAIIPIPVNDIDGQNLHIQTQDEMNAIGSFPTPINEMNEVNISNQFVDQSSMENILNSCQPQSEVSQRLNEILSNIREKLQTTKLEVAVPDFNPSHNEFKGNSKVEITGAWNRIRDMYNHAVKINELDERYGRVQRIEKHVEDLANQYPDLSVVQRCAGYFYWLLGYSQKAMKCYKQAAMGSFLASDWYDLAAIALDNNQDEIARESFEQFFRRSGAIKGSAIWCIYVNLCCRLTNYSFLTNLVGDREDSSSDDELYDFFEIGIYSLMMLDKEQLVSDFVSRSLSTQSIRILVGETYQKLIEEFAPHLLIQTQRVNGQIYSFKVNDGFGFLHDEAGIEYFFDIGEINEENLALELQNLKPRESLPVSFEATKTPKGPRAVKISRRQSRITKLQSQEFPRKLQGNIYSYKSYNTYGFLRAQNGQEYFFHRSAIIDQDLLVKLDNWIWSKDIPVFFEVGRSAKGKQNPLAIRLSLYRNLDDLFRMAVSYADEGEYDQAVDKIEEVISYNPEYPSARELYQTWQRYRHMPNIPKGKNVYARAKRAQIVEKNVDKAEQLFREAIQQKDNADNAVKDLTMLFAQLGEHQKAIDFLRKNRGRIRDQQVVDNMLVNLYQDAGQYDQAITLVQGKLKVSSEKNKNSRLLSQIATLHLEQGNYSEAEEHFRKILKQQPNNIPLERNLAISLIRQERFDEAEAILNNILDKSADAQASELLKTIGKAKETGQSATSIIIETTLSDFSTQISEFTNFLLARSEFSGVPPEQVKSQKFGHSDIKKLENLATQLGARRPKDRSEYYLSAAKIISTLDEDDDPDQFYIYLGRSFASRGDAAAVQTKPLDVVREFYSEALSAYDHVRTISNEPDAFYALVRYLFSILGHSRIPIKPKTISVQATIEEIFKDHHDPKLILNDIAYIVLRSRFAAQQILLPLYENIHHQNLAVQYLHSQSIDISSTAKGFENFVRLWDELRENRFNETRKISNELRLIRRIEFTTASLENSINRIKSLDFHFKIDHQRVQRLQQIFQLAFDLLREVSFEEQERLCNLIGDQCGEMLSEIEEDPTELSVEQLYPIFEIIQKKVDLHLQELYRSSMPQLTLRLAVETYAPGNNRDLDVQIAIENKFGCSPAESLELIVIAQEDETTFELRGVEIKLDSSLRGGDQHILLVPIKLTDDALLSKTFSISMYAQYRMRLGAITETPVTDFSIRLYSEDEFEKIENPYAAYAEGGPVSDLDMFYGRHELIDNATQAIASSVNHAKSIVIFGQKRAGKSSVLYHLKKNLQEKSIFLILDLGNIGSIIDPNSKTPFLYQVLWKILNELEYAIEDKVSEGFSDIGLSIPSSMEFYQHPTPLVFFSEVFDRYKRKIIKSNDWNKLQVVLLIDEFSYVYGQIIDGLIPESFMKNWKALLQKNYFSAVLAGQDVMPKFKQQFPNEFGTSQDERVSYLVQADAEKLIDEPIRIGGRNGESRYREQAVKRILALTAGSPFYIQIFCNRLVEYMNRQKAIYITEANVENVKDELISGVNALGRDKFENLFNSGDTSQDAISDEDTLNVLTDIALNSRTGPCNLSNIICKTQKPIDTILNDLVNREVVERSKGEYYQIRVQLFEEWLVTNR